jgi:predicted solute-binding protein
MISNIYNKCINRVKEYLPKNMKKVKIESIEKAISESINEASKINNIDEDNDIQNIKNDNEKYRRENIQLRLDNLKLHEENKKMHELILKINKDNEELNSINKDLSSIVEQFEKIDLKNTIGIYTEK